MTNLVTDPTTFASAAIEGFVLANPGHVRLVDGGVVRSTVIPENHVGVVIGGGSGHYPAFAGLVGPGLAAGAVCGNIFASPASGQAHRVCKAVERGAGILLTYGNYAGDVLQFGQAAHRLRGEGVDVRTLAVTDDVASASSDEIEKRRGIAGDLTVFKVAGAAAEEGSSLDEVERVAIAANDATRSFGVAFSGCTLPGATEPLFTVPEGTMAVGLGIHGEPGISEEPIPTADGLAQLLVDRLLSELPTGISSAKGQRAVVILNGLGTFKYEELFAVYGAIHARLIEAEVDIVDSLCGELVTSLDMSGASLTLFWVDDELERLWRAPADTPAFRTGVIEAEHDEATDAAASDTGESSEPAEPADAANAATLLEYLSGVRDLLVDAEDELGKIDAIAGDGDHGIGMSRGVTGALEAAKKVVENKGGVTLLLAEAGEAWSENGGGTSGALWGITLAAAGNALPAEGDITPKNVADAVAEALAAVQELGKAQVGDKTLVDVFVPFSTDLSSHVDAGDDLAAAWSAAAETAVAAADATADLKPKLGRARPHEQRSLGHPDAGAVSLSRIVTTVGEHLRGLSKEEK